MEIRIVPVPFERYYLEGVKDIVINGSHSIVYKEHFDDYKSFGYAIYVQYNKKMPLDEKKYNLVCEYLEPHIGTNRYEDDNLRIEVAIETEGNVVSVIVRRFIGGMVAGGFTQTNTPIHLLQERDDILNKINAMTKLNKHDRRYLNLSEGSDDTQRG